MAMASVAATQPTTVVAAASAQCHPAHRVTAVPASVTAACMAPMAERWPSDRRALLETRLAIDTFQVSFTGIAWYGRPIRTVATVTPPPSSITPDAADIPSQVL